MVKLRPYIALDLETTGLDTEKAHILQIGWVIDDGVSPRDQLEKGTCFIENPEIHYAENYAVGMNAWIFQELMKAPKDRKYPTETPNNGLAALALAIEKTASLALKFDLDNGEERPSKKVQLAGKNPAGFDWPIVKTNWHRYGVPNCIGEEVEFQWWADQFIDHRVIDAGDVFFEHFGRNPGFNKINKLIGWKDINHDALDDAMNVVVALRYRMGMNF